MATSSHGLSQRDSSSAILNICWLWNAIQLEASDCSSRNPGGSGAERLNRPMLSMPRNPSSKILDPVELLLGERRVDVGQRNGVESEIPSREPGVLQFVALT